MKRRRLLTQVYGPYIVIIFLSVVVASWFASHSLKKYYLEQTVSDLEAKARLTEKIILNAFSADKAEAEPLCREMGAAIKTRITAILPSGTVVCDSDKTPETMENHAERPEVKDALSGKVGVATRYSHEFSQQMIYVAVPVQEKGRMIGIVRTATPLTHVDRALNVMYVKSILGGVSVAIIAALMSYFVARRIARSVKIVKEGAERYSRGDFGYRIEASGSEEISALAETLNKMALQLMRLETMRRDFVANVSHELMTPVTNIKGFVETLKDGAAEDPERTKEFLRIILKHTDRLSAIVEDLLNLSRIEQGAESGVIRFEKGDVRDVVGDAAAMCRNKASEKGINIEVIVPEEIIVQMNGPLLEGAVVNLIDNAIKYSEGGSRVKVDAGKAGDEVYIRVSDSGCGIEAEHLQRIFERFYRVDKSRSRELGGTGLGLAIVKHVVGAHGGRIQAESVVGKGSVFTIYLPRLT